MSATMTCAHCMRRVSIQSGRTVQLGHLTQKQARLTSVTSFLPPCQHAVLTMSLVDLLLYKKLISCTLKHPWLILGMCYQIPCCLEALP